MCEVLSAVKGETPFLLRLFRLGAPSEHQHAVKRGEPSIPLYQFPSGTDGPGLTLRGGTAMLAVIFGFSLLLNAIMSSFSESSVVYCRWQPLLPLSHRDRVHQ